MRTNYKKGVWLSMLAVVLFLLAGCYPNKIEYVDEYDVAGTMYDEEADFSSYTTFAVADTIIHMTGEDEEDDPNFSREHDELILELLRDNMKVNGYLEIESPDSTNVPDIVLLVNAISSEYYQYWTYYWDYWYWYPGWGGWYPGWGGWYPWYPGYVTSYTTGTLAVHAWDSESYNPEDETVNSIWTGVIDGLLANNKDYTAARIEKQINQLFIQSEYFKK